MNVQNKGTPIKQLQSRRVQSLLDHDQVTCQPPSTKWPLSPTLKSGMVEKIQGHGKMVMDISNNNTFLYSRYIIYIYISIDTRPTHFKNNSLNIKGILFVLVCVHVYRVPGYSYYRYNFFYDLIFKKNKRGDIPG